MPRTKKKEQQTDEKETKRRRMPPVKSQEARQNQMIAMAENLAYEKLMNGTASSQIIMHYLNLGTKETELSLQSLEEDIKLKKAKTEAIETSKNIEKLYAKAITAMRGYSGVPEEEQDEEDVQRDDKT